METKICKTCGREPPATSFRLSKGGTKVATCNECINEKRAESRYKHTQIGGIKPAPFSDADFDGKEPREVIDLMSRAKHWLETRGYSIVLKGTYTQVREIKF